MKIGIHASSCAAALVSWLLASVLTLFILWSVRDRARLLRDNDNERILNRIFTQLREYDDVGRAIEADPVLSERIAGFAVYGAERGLNYRWGTAPLVFEERLLTDQMKNRFGRYTIPDQTGDRVKFILHFKQIGPQRMLPSFREPETEERRRQAGHSFALFTAGTYVYIDIAHPVYRQTRIFTAVLFPLCEAGFLGAVLYVRRLFLRNAEYRERIEGQKNLVVLGTAASTLAHEIKNPLLSIRLQTGILRKLSGGRGLEELEIIDEEVERLSELIYRVNDYLRDAEGNRVPVNPYDLMDETGRRLCGRGILSPDSSTEAFLSMDPSRARSVFENIIRNALESGGDEGEIGASIGTHNGSVVISVFDRGKGLDQTDMNRLFDPFFTRKSTGTGIGLSISKRFVEAVRGSIALEGREGGGTLVRIRIPEGIPPSVSRYERSAG